MIHTAVLSLAVVLSPSLMAADYNLKFAHFFPAKATAAQHFSTWAKQVEKDSEGRIKIDMYPSQTLAKAPKTYDAVINGIADLGVTIQGYTANRFPLTQIAELPGLAKSSKQGTCVVQNLYDEGLLKEEFSDVHPLFLFTHGAGHIHTSNKAITKPSDLKGLKIRRPTIVVAELLKQLGAQPVGMPAPNTYQSLSRGVLDGLAMPWDGVYKFRLNELTKYHTEIGLYTAVFALSMNKRVYESMPADLRAVIDRNSGLVHALDTSKDFDRIDIKGRAQAKDENHQIIKIEGGIDHPDWKGVVEQATQSYLSGLEAKGMPANKIYKRAQALAGECEV
ncbi:MAG: TRAP transporter substrate-binding protein [Halopseudomonas sp.]